MNAAYEAVVMGQNVFLFAFGENPTSGWRNYFQKSAVAIYPPEYNFVQDAPTGIVLEVISPFVAEATFPFDPTSPPAAVNVRDSAGLHTVPIRKVPTTAERALFERSISARLLLPGNARLKIMAKRGMVRYYERSLGSYDDLLSQHCSTECVRIDEIDHTGIKVCTEYRTVCQHIRVHAVLVVQTGSDQDIANAVEQSLQTAAIAAALAALLAAFGSGGAAAASAAKATFLSVLSSELSSRLKDLVRVDIDFRSEWV